MLKEAHPQPSGSVSALQSGEEESSALDLNAMVAYNVRAIRLLRGMTQDQVADRLAEFTGHRLPQASISQMERSFVDRRRRRLFDAHDLYLLAKVFDVPIVYFFLPPPTCLERRIITTGEPVAAIVDVLFGTSTSLRAVDSRLAEIAPRPTEDGDATSPHHSASLLPVIDCHARLREVAHLLEELLDHHRASATNRAMRVSHVADRRSRRLAVPVDVRTDRRGGPDPSREPAGAGYAIEQDATLSGPRCQRDAEQALEAVLAAVLIRLARREATAHAA